MMRIASWVFSLMNNLYQVTDTLLICQMIGCLAGLCVSVLLIQLVRTSWTFLNQRRPGILLSSALLVWNLGGLLNAGFIIAGLDYRSGPPKLVCAFGFTGLTFLTWAILDVWRLSVQGRWQRRIHKSLQALAAASGLAITACLWIDALGWNAPLSRTGIRVAAQAAFFVLVLAGVGLAMSSRPPRTARLCAGLTGFGVLGPVAALALIPVFPLLPRPVWAAISAYQEQSVNYVVVAAFILLARLRYTDVLFERALRCFAAIAGGLAIWLGLRGLRTTLPVSVREPAGLAVFTIVLIVALVLLTPVVNRAIRRLTKRIFQQPDFDGELHRLEHAFSQMTREPDVFQHAESVLIRLFGFVDAHIFGGGNLSPALQCELAAHDVLEFQSGSCTVPCDRLEADALLAVRQNRLLTHAVAIVRSPDQRGFLASEVSFLNGLAGLLASRLETMRVERENYERDRREATLRHQKTEAELQALRAQINPHFLFNALNTIADLIVMDAHKAERMTERLSDVFRYILTHSQTATSTVQQEIDYVRRYLEIEEARFRERLRVQVHLDPAAAEMRVPSLILQPIVENALKHGLAPKVAGGNLSIAATRTGIGLRLTVEDDGVGLHRNGTGGQPHARSTGVGLANTRQRLHALYGDHATVQMESPDVQGCRVTILIAEPQPCVL